MVEVFEEDGPQDGREDDLRNRVTRLTRELDQVEAENDRTCETFRSAIAVLAGLAPKGLDDPVAKAVETLRAASMGRPLDRLDLDASVEGLKRVLLAEVAASPQAAGPDQAQGQAARHIALALLQGLRLGQAEFDAYLDSAIKDVFSNLEQGRVRPAMALVVDLLGRYSDTLDQRRQQAEDALREILAELLSTEDELSQAFSRAHDSMALTGRDYEQQLNNSVGALAKDIAAAKDLKQIKGQALEHIRGMRNAIKARQAQDKLLLAKTQEELHNIRTTLADTRQRMARVEKLRKRLREEALTDPMTGLWNKRALTPRLGEALSHPAKDVVCLIVFDIDHFKQVNDNFGHQAGDRALRAIAERTQATLRANDVLFRYAGDEFVLLLTRTGLDEAKLVAERVRQAAETIKFTYGGQEQLTITVTLGLTMGKEGDTPESLFERADQALLEAKRAGRNQVGVG